MTQIPYYSKKMQRQRYRLITLFALGLLCASCTTESKARFTIVTTTSMLGDAVQNIVQDHARVVTLMGPGVDPHAYKATQQDVSHLMQADIIFFNGLHLEGKMAEILQKLRKRRPVYAASDALTEIQLLIDSHFPYGIDPHIWFDVSLWQQVVQHLSQQLQAADPALAAQYQANTAQYLQQLAALHTATQQAIQQIPTPQRVLITAHDAFGYFGRAYGLKVRGLQGLSTVSECGLKDVTELVKFIIQRNIKALFLETSVPDRPLKAVVEGCQQRGHPVAIGGYLYS
ncbi:MAG: zinc ABC transporter substrate-binding protein, partial [Bacteroidota bacterium]